MNILKNVFSKKEKTIKSYEDFWVWFQKNERAFSKVIKEEKNIEKDFFNNISPKLKDIKDGFYYLTGMFNDKTIELIFTADGNIKNIVFVEELVNAAPKIDGWLFTALKPALNIENVRIDMGGYKFDDKSISFYPNEHVNFADEIDITVVHNSLNEDNKSIITNGTYIFLDNFIGELNFATTIDSINVIGKENTQRELIPIEKLKDYLIWRQKEFIEKYDGIRHDTENDSYTSFKAELRSGNALIAVINTDLLSWESKTSHPWVVSLEIKYNGQNNKGMPDKETYKLLDEMENELLDKLKDSSGHLNIGRQTSDSVREVYFACKDFRIPSKVMHEFKHKFSDKFEISFDIYKDKYWRSFNRFITV